MHLIRLLLSGTAALREGIIPVRVDEAPGPAAGDQARRAALGRCQRLAAGAS